MNVDHSVLLLLEHQSSLFQTAKASSALLADNLVARAGSSSSHHYKAKHLTGLLDNARNSISPKVDEI